MNARPALALVLLAASARCATRAEPVITLQRPVPEWLLAAQPQGESPQLVLAHNARLVADEERWRALPDALDGAIVAAARIGERWLFASERGVVTISDSADGPLRRLTQTPGRLRRASAPNFRGEHGRSVAVNAQHAAVSRGLLPLLASPASRGLWLVNERGERREARFEHAPVAALFVSPEHGAVVLESGEARCTRDGGQHWTSLDAERDLITRIAVDGDRAPRIVLVGSSLYALDARCALSSMRGFASVRSEQQTVSLRALVQATAAVDPGSIGERWPSRGARVAAIDRALVVLDERTRRVVRFDHRALPSDSCAARPFGASMILVCATSERGERVWLATIDDPRAPIRPLLGEGLRIERTTRSLVESAQTWAVDARGRFALIAGACDERATRRTERDWCRVLPDGRRQPLVLATDAADAEGIVGDALVAGRAGAQRGSSGVFEREIAAFDAQTGAAMRIAPELTSPRARIAVSSDGTLYGMLDGAIDGRHGESPESHARAPRAFATRDPRTLQARALPQGAAGVGFIDAQRAVAFGTSAGASWFSDDGGARWREARAQVNGDPRTVSAEGWNSARVRPIARCGLDRCTIGSELVASWSSVTTTIFAREGTPLAPLSENSDEWPRHNLAPYLRAGALCRESVPVQQRPDALAPEADFVLAPGLSLRCETREPPWRCRFTGARARRFGVVPDQRFSLASLSRPEQPALDAGEEGFRLVGASGAGVVLQRNTSGRAQYLWIDGAMTPRWIEEPDDDALSAHGGGSFERGRDLPWLVRQGAVFTAVRVNDAARSVAVIERRADRENAAVTTKALAGTLSPGWLAERDGVVGWLAPSWVVGEHLFWPSTGARPVRVRSPWRQDLSLCSDSASDGRDTVIVLEPNITHDATGASWAISTSLVAELSWSEGASCARSVLYTPWQTRSSPTGIAAEWSAERSETVLRQQAGPSSALSAHRCPR